MNNDTGHKYGNVPTRRAWVGLTWDGTDANRVHRHSVSIYTKGFTSNDASREMMNKAIYAAVRSLNASN